MTATAVTLGTTPATVDFTLASTDNYQLSGGTGTAFAQQSWPSTTRSLWPGNMSNNMLSGQHSGDRIIYQGTGADIEEAYFKALLDPGNASFLPNYIVNEYHRADANMDGKIIYQGADADTDVVFFSVLLFPDNTGFLPNYVIFEQIPK
jgi:hypothetical protein